MAYQEWDHKVIQIRRVTRVTKGGKRFKMRAVVVSGNRSGRVGVGIGRGDDIAQAVIRARKHAEAKSITIPMINETIPFEVRGGMKSSDILVKPAPKGTGLVAGGSARIVLDLAGVPNAVSKILGKTKNPLLNALGSIETLKKLSQYEIKDYSSQEEKDEKAIQDAHQPTAA